MPKGITKIIARGGMGKNPASTKRSTGVVYINQDIWPGLTRDERLFVLLHEEGHIVLNTTNELKADGYAAAKYFKQSGSLKTSIKILKKFVRNGPRSFDRIMIQAERALLYDWRANGNKKALQTFKNIVKWQRERKKVVGV